jgi:ParB-like chromosome segregation protein Spo0J
MKFPRYKAALVADLIPYARNSRTHSDAQVGKIAASIQEFGFLNPVIIDGNNGIVAGHGRVLAAQKLGMAEVPVIEASHLTEAQRRAYVIADNRLALDAGWDEEMLRVEFEELEALGFDLELTGFHHSEINLDEIDYSVLDGDSVDEKINNMAAGVKKAIQIEFEPDHYEEAQELVKFWRDQGAYIGAMLIELLKKEKENL